MVISPEQKIKDDIRREYAETYPNCIFSLTNYVERLKAERAAIAVGNAAKDDRIAKLEGVLRDYIMSYGCESCSTNKTGKHDDRCEGCEIPAFDALLTTRSDKLEIA